ncbi:glycoside hydrolase family 3 protein [Candidatus Woesebacteria bacterium]|nr:glycoside hydrolase family 3 protein [Candidatus Woesebacteria bacterium]
MKEKLKIKQLIFIGLLIILLIMLGINYFVRPFEGQFVALEEKPIQENLEPVVQTILTSKDTFDKLSAKQKIEQMIAFPLVVDGENDNSGDLSETFKVSSDSSELVRPGFIIIFGDEISTQSAQQTIIGVNNLYKESLLFPKFAVDHEGGKVQRLSGDGYLKLPSWKDLCEIEDVTTLESSLRKSATELKATGIDIVLAPVVDVGNNRVMQDRICSDSYAVVAERSLEFISVFDSFGILPVIKHFPGIGETSKDLHNEYDFVRVTENDVKLFNYIIGQSPNLGVLVSHAGVINQDLEIPCSLSKSCIGELKAAFPNVLVFSDALEMKSASFNSADITKPKDLIEVTKEAILAGNEVLIYGKSVDAVQLDQIIDTMVINYNKDDDFRNQVDSAVLKIIDYKYKER